MKIMNDKLFKLFFAIFFISLWLIPLIIFWKANPNGGFFVNNFLSALYLDLRDAHLNINFFGTIPGHKPLLATIHQITGISIENLQHLPVALGLRIIVFFALIKKVFDAYLPASLFATIVAFTPFFGNEYYTIFVHAWGSFLFPLFFLMVLLLIEPKRSKKNKKILLLLALLIFVTTLFLDYTVTMWIILFMLTLAVFYVLSPKLREGVGIEHFGIVIIVGVLALLAVFFVLKFNFIYDYLKQVNVLSLIKTLPLSFLSSTSSSVPHEYTYTRTVNSFISYTSRSFYVLVLIPTLIFLLVQFREFLKSKFANFSTDSILVLTLLITGGLALVVYMLYGRFTQFYIALMLPLIGVMSLKIVSEGARLRERIANRMNVYNIFLLILLLLISMNYSFSWQTGNFPANTQTDAKFSSNYLLEEANGRKMTILSDLNTIGKYKMNAALHDKSLWWVDYDLKTYKDLLNGKRTPSSVDYVIIDIKTDGPISSMHWANFEPLSKHMDRVDRNTKLGKVYANDLFVIMDN